MEVIFYKAKYGKLFDKLIAFWTRGEYSHCEIRFSDGNNFSADSWENEVRFKKFTPSSKKWDTLKIPDYIANEELCRKFCETQVGKKYDWLGIFLSQLIPLNIHDKNKFFCSEIDAKALSEAGIVFEISFNKIHPNKLYKILKKIKGIE